MTPEKESASAWLDFWNGAQRVYVNDRHREVHYRRTAELIIALLPGPDARVLDYGPGDALQAGRVAAAAGHLTLCEAAESLRRRLAAGHAGNPDITVIGPADLAGLPGESVDLVVVNSVVQYLGAEEFGRLLGAVHRILAPDGRLLIGDVVPRRSSMIADALALLRYAARERFLGAAVLALLATAFSRYSRIRKSLGLSRYDEAEMAAGLTAAGFSPARHRPNLSHNQARLAFIAAKSRVPDVTIGG